MAARGMVLAAMALLGGAGLGAFIFGGVTGAVAQSAEEDDQIHIIHHPPRPPLSIGPCSLIAHLRIKGEKPRPGSMEFNLGPNVSVTSIDIQLANKPIPGSKRGIPASFGPDGPLTAPVEFCRVVGRIEAEKGSDIRFEVWMPTQGWNGRYMGVGNGGLAGSINYGDLVGVVATGQATSSTDTGHQADSGDGRWAKGNPAKQRDYGWRAVHLTAVAAKRIIANFYGKPADTSYFSACSNGGRQGLHEAARFPGDYDGIIAGAPASRLSATSMSMINAAQAQSGPGAAIRPEQAKFIQREVIAQCDAIDGLNDGLIDDPRQCKVDVAKLQCGVSTDGQCLSAPQAKAVERIFNGYRDARGRLLAHPFLPAGAEAGNPIPFLGWEGWLAAGGKEKVLSQIYPQSLLNDFPDPPLGDQAGFNWDRDPTRFRRAMAKDIDAPANMRRFFARGGKLIIWHGWADAAIPAQETLDMHADILRQSGPKAKDNMRLFMVPGMQHCGGGTGAGAFGQMGAPTDADTPETHIGAAMQHWVEKGRAPQNVVGTTGFAFMGRPAPNAKQRLHCAWPAKAVLTPGADPDKATSYNCEEK